VWKEARTLTRYAKCLYDRQSINNQRIEHLLNAYDPSSIAGEEQSVDRRSLAVDEPYRSPGCGWGRGSAATPSGVPEVVKSTKTV